jgi:hypothetical protein
MVVHVYNLSTWETGAVGSQIGASLGYIVRLCLKTKPKPKTKQQSQKTQIL